MILRESQIAMLKSKDLLSIQVAITQIKALGGKILAEEVHQFFKGYSYWAYNQNPECKEELKALKKWASKNRK